MDFILPPVGIRTLDPKFLYLWGFEDTRLNDEDAGDICFYNFPLIPQHYSKYNFLST